MNLVKYSDNPEAYLNMNFIERVGKINNKYIVLTNSKANYEISESAYNTILAYGKAKI